MGESHQVVETKHELALAHREHVQPYMPSALHYRKGLGCRCRFFF